MHFVAMNDDQHNDVWFSCYHGNGASFGKVSQKVLFLKQLRRKSTQSLRQETFFLQIMFTMVYVMNLKWLAGLDCLQRKKSEKLQFTKTGIFGQ